jgi:hypothetical protein
MDYRKLEIQTTAGSPLRTGLKAMTVLTWNLILYTQDKDTHHETIVIANKNGDNLTYTATIKGTK